MRRVRSLTWVLTLGLIVAMLVPGGVYAAPAARPLAQEGEPAFQLELPRIVVTIDEQGFPSVFGLSVGDIQNMTGMDMSMARVPDQLMQMLAAAGVQHIEVVINGDGLFLFVNGQPLPYLEWDQERLNTLVSALQAFQVPNAPLIGRFVPFMQYISISLAVKFPLPEGASEIPLRDTDEFFLVDAQAAAGEVETVSLKFIAHVDVDADGVPSILGVSTRQIQEDTGIDLSTAVVPANLMAQLNAGGVQHVQVQTMPDGLYLYMNGQALPRLAWDGAHLQTLADLVPKLMADQPWAPLAGQALAKAQAADIRLAVRFPVPAGAQELPLHEFATR